MGEPAIVGKIAIHQVDPTLDSALVQGQSISAPLTLSGKVVDASTQQGLANAFLQVEGSKDTVRTNAQGLFELSLSAADQPLTLEIYKHGYETVVQKVIPSTTPSALTIALNAKETAPNLPFERLGLLGNIVIKK